jgi:hypothetical protein
MDGGDGQFGSRAMRRRRRGRWRIGIEGNATTQALLARIESRRAARRFAAAVAAVGDFDGDARKYRGSLRLGSNDAVRTWAGAASQD